MAHKRSDKVAETIHELISSILSRGLNDPRIGFVTITAVEVTDDLHLARVFFTVIGDDTAKKESEAGLNSAKGFLRRELGKSLTMRYTPDLLFKYDHSGEYGSRIDSLLKEIDTGHE
ncbi:ribosome-binding factor A [Geobacter sp. FeAm09]|uniref:ribosome-binding factor A n=1 Tax=Geobacter sp. FeAm09 TaxID=2597769 RepID=UPI0011F00937|nr:ribosome-binding factor A [Geobacter sp. FeAm09]QEM67854.1 ribosome-binding factor A [Geobacter sp. FeAm09]